MDMIYELDTVYDSAKSFYNKAHVIVSDDGTQTLRSYTTDVAFLKNGVLTRAEGQPESATTARHMREFARQCGLGWMSKAQLSALPVK